MEEKRIASGGMGTEAAGEGWYCTLSTFNKRLWLIQHSQQSLSFCLIPDVSGFNPDTITAAPSQYHPHGR